MTVRQGSSSWRHPVAILAVIVALTSLFAACGSGTSSKDKTATAAAKGGATTPRAGTTTTPAATSAAAGGTITLGERVK